MARTLTPERQQLKQQAISLRYDYGLTERKIANQLCLTQTTIHRFLNHNLYTNLNHNNNHITHLQGDCLEILPTLPDKSIGWMSISTLDVLYSLRAFLGCVIYPSYPFPTPFERIKSRNFLPPSSITLIGTFVRSTEVIV